jgi:hypothetical protein
MNVLDWRVNAVNRNVRRNLTLETTFPIISVGFPRVQFMCWRAESMNRRAEGYEE